MTDFRKMRRHDRQMPDIQAEALLSAGTWGVLSVLGDNGYPYGVPVNYGYTGGKLYIHSSCADSHKLHAVRHNCKVCFTVVAEHTLLEEQLTTQFSSVIVFGTARILEDPQEKRQAAVRMIHALAPNMETEAIKNCAFMNTVAMIEITPEHITGKCRK